jgi:hypothetical protein
MIREVPPEDGEDDEEVAAGGACPICERAAGDCDHLVASIDLTYSEVIAGALFARERAVLDALEHLCSSDPDGLKVAGAGPVLEHVATLVRNEIAEGASPGDALSICTTQILAALSLLMQEDEDVTATNVDGDSSIENLWAQDPEWAVERLVERLEVLVNEIDEERREER